MINHISNASIRIKINGSSLINPSTDKEIVFNGFNWYLPYIEANDTITMQSLIPSSNIVRLQSLYWDNWVDNTSYNYKKWECRTDNATNNYIKPSCIEMLKQYIDIITSLNSPATPETNNWVILMVRGEYAAGQLLFHLLCSLIDQANLVKLGSTWGDQVGAYKYG